MDHSSYFCRLFVMLLCTSFYWCLAVTCWERAGLLALVCDVLLCVCSFPIGVLDQVWYLIVSIPDLCHLYYFVTLTIDSIMSFLNLMDVQNVRKNTRFSPNNSYRKF